ncbi:hypothetical protein SLEP1_g36901 [Rubroshorea leprosula]|uniref:Uncharacterized protein n=1 Tax=Rubroshorea leprosula TaxID=152421 RepID=A0AAV5KT52_9ROSI|nr:hypothetical protein SLEP1_g36901 [Rubroshorea leprosula]
MPCLDLLPTDLIDVRCTRLQLLSSYQAITKRNSNMCKNLRYPDLYMIYISYVSVPQWRSLEPLA